MKGWELATVYIRRNAQGVIVAIQSSPPIDDSGTEETRLKTECRRLKANEVERAIKDYAAKKRKEVRP